MVLKPDQEHIRELLAETITLLCCNGLHFKSEFSIDALIGITIDQDEVFLVSIKETFQNGRAVHANKRQQTSSRPIVNRETSSSCDFNDSGSSDISKRMWNSDKGQEVLVNDSGGKDIHQYSNLTQNFNSRDPKLTGNKRKHRIPSKFGLGQKEMPDSISDGELAYGKSMKRLLIDTPESFVNRVDEKDSVRYLDDTFAMSEVLSKNKDLQRTHVRHGRINDLTESCEKDKELVELQDHDDCKFVQIKQEPVEKSLLPTNRMANGSNSRPHPAASLGRDACGLLSSVCSQNSFFLHLEDSIPGCSSWNAHESPDELNMSFQNRSRWLIEQIDTQPSEREVSSFNFLAIELKYM